MLILGSHEGAEIVTAHDLAKEILEKSIWEGRHARDKNGTLSLLGSMDKVTEKHAIGDLDRGDDGVDIKISGTQVRKSTFEKFMEKIPPISGASQESRKDSASKRGLGGELLAMENHVNDPSNAVIA